MEKQIIPCQLGLLEDVQGVTLQQRFEQFGIEAADSLTATNSHGDPILPAGKHKAEFQVKVTVMRLSDDSLSFDLSHETRSKLPRIPGQGTSAVFTCDNGLVKRYSPDQFPLFDPAGGQPVAPSTAQVTDDDHFTSNKKVNQHGTS